jgi:hypothetical protein
MSPESVLKIGDRTDARKLDEAHKMLGEFEAAKDRSGGASVMNLRPVLVFYGRLAGFVLLVECVTFWGWSKWFWTLVQAQYMGAYLRTSVPGMAPDSELRIRWIWKTSASGKRALAIEDHAVPGALQRARNAPLSIGAGGWLDRSCGGTSGADSQPRD